MKTRFYVYEWYKTDTGEVFYVGKGSMDRWKSLKGRNPYFMNVFRKYHCCSRIVIDNLDEAEAFMKEKE